jgi:hypothetical protein
MSPDHLKLARRCFLAFVALLAGLIFFDFGQKLRTPISHALENWRAGQVTWANFENIAQGMSHDQVIGILNRQPDASVPDIPPQPPVAGAARVEYWSYKTDVITVWFDANERVLATSYSFEETVLTRARLWLQRLL